ncbi:MAG: hypothetical protein R2857_10305 [Vampirovibrionales bacterium]
MTMYRAESTDQPEQVKTILTTLDSSGHPPSCFRYTRASALYRVIRPYRHIRLTDPMG